MSWDERTALEFVDVKEAAFVGIPEAGAAQSSRQAEMVSRTQRQRQFLPDLRLPRLVPLCQSAVSQRLFHPLSSGQIVP